MRYRRSPEEWEKIVSEYQQSGLGQQEFCRKKGIKYYTFNPWKRRIMKEITEGFVEIKTDPPVRNDYIEIVITSLLRIKIPWFQDERKKKKPLIADVLWRRWEKTVQRSWFLFRLRSMLLRMSIPNSW